MSELFNKWKNEAYGKNNYRRQKQHIRRYRSGKSILVNRGVHYKTLLVNKTLSELDRQIKLNRDKLNAINQKLFAYQGLLKKTIRPKEKDLLERSINILRNFQGELENYILELQREKLLMSIR